MCGFLMPHFVIWFQKKNWKKNQVLYVGGMGIVLQILLLADIFFQCLDSTALFIIFFFFFDIFCFIKKEIKIRKPLQEKNFFLKKKIVFFTKKWHRFFHGLARKNNSKDNSSNNCVVG